MNKISYLTRFSYAAPAILAGQLVFSFIIASTWLLILHGCLRHLRRHVRARILLIARWTDAIDAPVWGIIFDKTHSRWGKSRPWFLWLCVPFAMFGVLTFLTPDLGTPGKSLYAAALTSSAAFCTRASTRR